MDLVRLFIKRISYNQSQNDAFVLIMHELESDLKLPIVIGAFEAQSIALELEKNIIHSRPLQNIRRCFSYQSEKSRNLQVRGRNFLF